MSESLKNNRKVYFLSHKWRIALVALSIILLAMPFLPKLLSLRISGTLLEFFCFFAFVFSLGGWGLYEAAFNRIVTSPQGIEYYFALSRTTSSWKNVKYMEANHFGIVNLVLYEPSLKSIPPFSWYFRLFRYDRLIQLSPYISDWQTSELVQDIKRFAPHALETKDASDAD